MLTVKERYVEDTVIQTLYKNKVVNIESDNDAVNAHVIFRSNLNSKSTALARHLGDGTYTTLIHQKKNVATNGIVPRDAHQVSLMDSILNPDILLSVGIGSAGTGKTTMALAYAAQQYIDHGKIIQLTKPTSFIGSGNAFGPVPGNVQEKYDPYLQSYYIVLEKIFGKDTQYFKKMMENEDLQFTPIALARGCTFENATFIIDEAQNLTWHELNSIISRMGEGTKCIALGDLKQVDVDIALEDTGLAQLVNSETFRNSAITSGVELITQYRSPITQLIAEVHEEIRDNRQEKSN